MRPECCTTCAADPKAAPQRYCLDYEPPAMPENVHPLIPWKEAG